MKKINYYGLSLSELSFIVLTNTNDSNARNNAYNEIKRRFSTNGCNYDGFMDYEEDAIKERGNNISEYIINPNASSQKLMEIYFNYVHGNITMHGDLLFSELLLCNGNCKNSFFVNFIKNEIQKIKTRMASNNLTQDDIDILQFVNNALDERLKNSIPFYREDNIIDAVYDIAFTTPYFLLSEKKYEKISNKEYNDNNIINFMIDVIPTMIGERIFGSVIITDLAMELFIQQDNARLTRQKRSILKCKDEIDYSFIDKSKVLKLNNKNTI